MRLVRPINNNDKIIVYWLLIMNSVFKVFFGRKGPLQVTSRINKNPDYIDSQISQVWPSRDRGLRFSFQESLALYLCTVIRCHDLCYDQWTIGDFQPVPKTCNWMIVACHSRTLFSVHVRKFCPVFKQFYFYQLFRFIHAKQDLCHVQLISHNNWHTWKWTEKVQKLGNLNNILLHS